MLKEERADFPLVYWIIILGTVILAVLLFLAFYSIFSQGLMGAENIIQEAQIENKFQELI